MRRERVAVAGLAFVLATSPLRGQERSYGATKEVVWNALHEALLGLKVSISKEDKDKGEIQSDPAPTDSTYLHCELHVARGRPEPFYFSPKAKLEVSVRERSASETSLRIKFTGKKTEVNLGSFMGRMVCESTGRLEEDLLGQIQSRLAVPSGKP